MTWLRVPAPFFFGGPVHSTSIVTSTAALGQGVVLVASLRGPSLSQTTRLAGTRVLLPMERVRTTSSHRLITLRTLPRMQTPHCGGRVRGGADLAKPLQIRSRSGLHKYFHVAS